jgi:electron transfer flavoprotein alpha subunit
MSVFAVLEERDGSILAASWEALTVARKLGSSLNLPVVPVLLGATTQAHIDEVSARHSGTIIRIEHALLESYTPDGYCSSLQQLIQAESPAYVIFSQTYQVAEFAPALSTRFGQVLISDVIAIDDGPLFTRQVMRGRLNGIYRHCGNGPCFVSIQAGAFRSECFANENEVADIRTFTPALEAAQIRTKPGKPFRDAAQAVDLQSAESIVGVGRGIQQVENLSIIRELANVMGAEIAASRPVCDNGWLPNDRQLGSSGQSVAPKLYVAIGISGAIQHITGVRGAGCIVAINNDPAAPIFDIADYGIVGDQSQIVPALTEAIKLASQ